MKSKYLVVLVAALVLVPVVASANILGQVNARHVEINGVATPSHTTLLSSSTVETADHPAIVHLGSGQTLSVAPHSQAHFGGSLETGVEVSLRFGSLAYRDGSGEVIQIADAGTFMLQQGGVQQGEAIGGGAGFPMCALKSGDVATCLDNPDNSACEWEFLESIGSGDIDAYIAQGATFLTAGDVDSYFSQAGKSSAGKTIVVNDCRDKKRAAGVAAAAAAGGLSTAAIAGIAVGGALGVVIIDDATGGSSPGVTSPVGTQITP